MTTPHAAPQGSGQHAAWLGVLALTLGAFIFNTSEFVPVGLLASIGQSFAMRPEQTGVLLTLYAWVVALASVPLMLLPRRWERRRLLLWVFALFIACQALTGLATSFALLALARLGVAVAHAVFWSITASLVVRIAPTGKKAQALSLLATGTTLAMVLGVPLGRIVGEALDWRSSFWLIGAVAILVAVVLARSLPPLPSEDAGSVASIPVLLRRPALMAIFGLQGLVVTAQFILYSYIEPWVQVHAGHSPAVTTSVLLLFGAASILGSLLFSRWGLKLPLGFLLCALATLASCLGVLSWAGHAAASLYALTVVWGAAIMAVVLPLQALVLHWSRDATDVGMAIFSSVFNLSIGAGALLGSQMGQHLGLGSLPPSAAALAGLALWWTLWAQRRWQMVRAG